MKKHQSGFTLIELVLVIVILGILAATALPRFSDISSDARRAAVQGLAGGVTSATSLAHATSLAQGLGAGITISMEGQPVTMQNFYPTANPAGIQSALQDFTGFTHNGAGRFDKNGAPTPATCSVTYVAAGVGTSPTVSPDTAGC